MKGKDRAGAMVDVGSRENGSLPEHENKLVAPHMSEIINLPRRES